MKVWRSTKQKEDINRAILTIFVIVISVGIISLLATFLLNFSKWQDGYSADEWLYAGLDECDIEYDEVNFIAYDTFDDNQYGQVISYSYETNYYDIKDSNSINDVDIYYGKLKKYYITITFAFSDNFWNKLDRAMSSSYKTQKYTKCLDFDIFVEEKNE